MLMDNSGLATHAPAGILLVAIGGVASFASHRLLKKRWLM
jgi:hypothetical protein